MNGACPDAGLRPRRRVPPPSPPPLGGPVARGDTTTGVTLARRDPFLYPLRGRFSDKREGASEDQGIGSDQSGFVFPGPLQLAEHARELALPLGPATLLQFLLTIAAGLFTCKVASGTADLIVRILRHKAAQRWPGLVAEKPRRGSAGTGESVRGPKAIRNGVHGDVSGVVVQAGRVDRLHLHLHGCAAPEDRPGPAAAGPPENDPA